MGLKDITFGYDNHQASKAEGALAALAAYEGAIGQLTGARDPHKKDLKVYSFQPSAFVQELDSVIEALAAVVEQAGNTKS